MPRRPPISIRTAPLFPYTPLFRSAEAPAALNTGLAYEYTSKTVASEIVMARDVLYLGRGTDYPIALEGALKLKEISYIHAEGYAAGEMKHGPIALIDENVPVIVIAPSGPLFEKTVSNMQEVQARGGKGEIGREPGRERVCQKV